MSTISSISSLETRFKNAAKSGLVLNWLIILMGSSIGIVAAYLIVKGEWQIAFSLALAVPGLILLHKYPLLGVIIWLILTPFLLHTETGAERRVYWIIHRGLPPITVIFIVLKSTLYIERRKMPKLGAPELFMAGYVAVSLLSIYFQSSDPLATVYHYYDRVISPMCLYLIIRLLAPNEKEMKWLIPVAFFLSFSQSVIGIIAWFAPHYLPNEWLDKVGSRTVGTLINTSVFTTAITFSGLLSLQGALNSRSGIIRKSLIIAFLLSIYSIFIAFSRASWLAGILVILGLFYLYPKFLLKLGLFAIPVALILAGVFADQIYWARERLISERAENSALSRLPVFYAAYRMFQTKPIFGWGYDNFDEYDRRYQGRVADLANDNKDHASHNTYLTIGAEQGIVGLIAFLGPLLWWLVYSLKILPKLPNYGFRSSKLLIILWLVILTQVINNNFMNLLVVFGHGIWWIVLGLIGNIVNANQKTADVGKIETRIPRAWNFRPSEEI